MFGLVDRTGTRYNIVVRKIHIFTLSFTGTLEFNTTFGLYKVLTLQNDTPHVERIIATDNLLRRYIVIKAEVIF
jgi:hypothetical protein